MDDKLKHDFINNALRLEVLNKLICEKLEQNSQPEKEHLEDIEKFLKEHLKYIQTYNH